MNFDLIVERAVTHTHVYRGDDKDEARALASDFYTYAFIGLPPENGNPTPELVGLCKTVSLDTRHETKLILHKTILKLGVYRKILKDKTLPSLSVFTDYRDDNKNCSCERTVYGLELISFTDLYRTTSNAKTDDDMREVGELVFVIGGRKLRDKNILYQEYNVYA